MSFTSQSDGRVVDNKYNDILNVRVERKICIIHDQHSFEAMSHITTIGYNFRTWLRLLVCGRW